VTDPRSLARWRCSGRTAAASLSPSNSDPGLTALELRALEAIRAAGGEGTARTVRDAGVTTTATGAGLLLLDLVRAGLLERTRRGWKLSADGEGPK
jgi:hypothetical protein